MWRKSRCAFDLPRETIPKIRRFDSAILVNHGFPWLDVDVREVIARTCLDRGNHLGQILYGPDRGIGSPFRQRKREGPGQYPKTRKRRSFSTNIFGSQTEVKTRGLLACAASSGSLDSILPEYRGIGNKENFPIPHVFQGDRQTYC
jgi:hypothetical protein